MEIKGKLKQINPVIERQEFKSRKIWVTTEDNPQYPQTIELEVSGKSLDIFEGVSIDAPVVCHVNLRGREWTGTDGITKVFNTIQCWRVEADKAAAGFGVPALPALDNDVPF